MGSYFDFVTGSYMTPSGYYTMYRNVYNRSHGGTRYALSQVPIFGQMKQFEDNAQKYEDAYQNNGIDALYSSSYGGSALQTGAVGIGKTMKMARTLADVFTPDVSENVQIKRAGERLMKKYGLR